MRYGKMFKNFINTYDYIPSKNRCSSLTYNELRMMAKLMYYDIVEICKQQDQYNPLDMYMRQNHQELIINVYKALRILFN